MATTIEVPIVRPLMDHDAAAPLVLKDARRADDGDRSLPWFTFVGFLVLTFNCGMAIVQSHGDTMVIAFVGFSYADLVALFACLKMHERAPPGSSTRWWLKVAVWVLTTLLTVAFSCKVAAVMPPPVAVLVWLMAFATVAGGFIAFFLYEEKKNDY